MTIQYYLFILLNKCPLSVKYVTIKNTTISDKLIAATMLLELVSGFSSSWEELRFSSFSVGAQAGIPDGKSEKSFCSTDSCNQTTIDVPFKRAFNPHSTGYDCGDGEEGWKEPEYSRVHRDIDVINAMREWMFTLPEKDPPAPCWGLSKS